MKKIVNYNDRVFICNVEQHAEGVIKITVYERKRPKWPIFKDSYCGIDTVFEVDFPTIEAAIIQAINNTVDDFRFYKGSKWERFKADLNKPLEL